MPSGWAATASFVTASLADAAEPSLHLLKQHDGVFQDFFARDVMTPLAVCLHEDQTIDEAAEFFLCSGISSTPVLKADGALAGFLSKKDLLAVMVSPDCWRQPLYSVMRPNVVTYGEETPIRVIYEFLCRVSIHSVVITKHGRPTGIISQNSLLCWFRNGATDRGLILPDSSSLVPAAHGTADTASVCDKLPPQQPPSMIS